MEDSHERFFREYREKLTKLYDTIPRGRISCYPFFGGLCPDETACDITGGLIGCGDVIVFSA